LALLLHALLTTLNYGSNFVPLKSAYSFGTCLAVGTLFLVSFVTHFRKSISLSSTFQERDQGSDESKHLQSARSELRSNPSMSATIDIS
jgi:hypothetical protein